MYIPKECLSNVERKNKPRPRKLLTIFWKGILNSGQKYLTKKKLPSRWYDNSKRLLLDFTYYFNQENNNTDLIFYNDYCIILRIARKLLVL